MAQQREKDVREENTPDSLSDRELFADEAQEPESGFDFSAFANGQQLSEYEAFAGDEDFYKLLADSTQDTPVRQPGGSHSLLSRAVTWHRRFSTLQKVLAVSTVAVASILVCVALRRPSEPAAGEAPTSLNQTGLAVPQMSASTPPAAEAAQMVSEQVGKPESSLLRTQPFSLGVARNFYLQKNYEEAYAAYDRLVQAIPASEEFLRDFLQLRMAVCAKELADFELASRLFSMVAESGCPVVRVVANYHLSLLEIRRKRYLPARTRAYKTIALIKAVEFADDWALLFECDCHFLAAECLTRHILSLSSPENELPDDLWGKPTASSDPFGDLDEAQLRSFLNSGSAHLGRGLLDPKILRLESQGGLPRFSITSYGAPVEELVAKFAGIADLDVDWAFEGTSGPGSQMDTLGQRPVSLYLPAATSEQAVLIAAGCAGLLADLEDDPAGQKVTIWNPADYSSLNRHVSSLSRQAISLWQKFVLTFYSDERLGNAHFVMGLLQSQTGSTTEAIAQYKLVANRFSQMSVAPFALLNSSKLKAGLRDYHGARELLKQLVEQYPDTEIYGRAYLRLADATMEAGLNAQAARLYQRVYNFGLSPESKTASAFRAAKCFYETKAYEDSAKWLARYIDSVGGERSDDLYSAYFLLGKANLALGKYQEACEAFQYAMTEQNSREQYIEAVTALVRSHIEQEDFVEALHTLENVRSIALSQEQSVEMLLLRSEVLRMLGLVETAAASLSDRAEYILEPQLRARVSFELAECLITRGDLEPARGRLGDVLSVAEPGPLAQKAALELADVCLKLGRSPQTISVCLKLLESNVPAETRQQALKMLAAAHNQQKDYEKAALALSGQWE